MNKEFDIDERRNLSSMMFIIFIPFIIFFVFVVGMTVFGMVVRMKAAQNEMKHNEHAANVVDANNMAVPANDPLAQQQQIYLQPELQPAPVVVMVDPNYPQQPVNNLQQQPMMQAAPAQPTYMAPGPELPASK